MNTQTPHNLSVLLLAADSGEGALGNMLDPRLAARFASEGIQCQACYISDLNREHLDLFHCIILLRTPVPQHPFGDEADFREKIPWLREFVATGGGMLIMFTECYGKTESTLNELCAPWQIRFFFNRLAPDSHVRSDRFPRLYESTLLPVQVVSSRILDLPFTELKIVTEGGHGTQHLTCVPDANSPWQTLMHGGPHIASESFSPFYIGSSSSTITDPILCAAREMGAGRLVAFPGSAPFWLTNSHIWRFQGLLQEQDGGRGFIFFRESLRWLASTPRNRRLAPDTVTRAAGAIDRAWLNKTEQCSFQPVAADQQQNLRQSQAQKIWIGSCALDTPSLTALADQLQTHEYRAAFPLGQYEELTEARWNNLLGVCRHLDRQTLSLHAGYNLHDDEGVKSAVVSSSTFPKHVVRYPNSTLLENVWISIFGCLSILRHPLTNRIPPQRYGGYNLLEWENSGEWFDLYRKLVASKYFISPIVFNTTTGQDSLNTWVLIPRGQNAYDMLRTNKHATFISNGPVLDCFTWSGPGLIMDEWEGYWYGYTPGETVELLLAVRSESPLVEIVLYDGEDILMRFSPNTEQFKKRISLTLWRDLSLHLTARDEVGRQLFATFPLYTRNLRFWGHVGSDQMNNYVNAMTPSPSGYLGVGHEFYDMFGFVTLGAAWGDYLRITPSLSYAEFMPRQEISGIIGSFNVHHPSAVLAGKNGYFHYLNDHRRVFPFCGADAQVFSSNVVGEHMDNDRGLRETWYGREITPTRTFHPIPGAECQDEYVVWRWEVNKPICVEIRKRFCLASSYLQDPWFTFASNSHWNLPGLFIRSMRNPAHVTPIASLPLASTGTPRGKEWDNSFFLRMAGVPPSAIFTPQPGNELEIGTGGAGTFGLVPLGPSRDLRVKLWATPKEVQFFFQCRLTEQERCRGTFTLAYLVVLDATEITGSPFTRLLTAIDSLSAGERTDRRFSVSLDVKGRDFPLDLDWNKLFPTNAGTTLFLELCGLPSGLVEWRDPNGNLIFSSHPQQGRSWHMIQPDQPRQITGKKRSLWT